MPFLVFALIIAAIAVVLILVRMNQRASLARQNIPKALPPVLFIVAVLVAAGGTIVVVPAGHVGVPVLFGKVQQYSLPEGMHVINPLLNIVRMSVRTEVYTMSIATGEGQKRGDDSITVLSKDGLRMPLDISVAYRLVAEDAPEIYRRLGENYVDKVIRPTSRTAIREAASQFSAQGSYSTKRQELAKRTEAGLISQIKALLSEEDGFKGKGFVIQQVMLRNVSLPPRLRHAIEEKLSMEQEVERMKFVNQKETLEAERKKIEAMGIQQFQNIVAQGISEKLLQWKGIEATIEIAKSKNAKVIIIGGGKDGLPIILNTDK